MASAVHSLRLSLRAPIKRAVAPTSARPRPLFTLRRFSSSPLQRLPEGKTDDSTDRFGATEQFHEEEDDFPYFSPEEVEEAMDSFDNNKLGIRHFLNPRVPKMSEDDWNGEEEDPEMILASQKGEQKFKGDDITSIAHAKLEEYREHREYARIAAWEMPLLSKLVTPFKPPTAEQPLRFRYTSYMGEFHPAEKKVVVEFSPRDLPLTEAQRLKLRKLLGPRWNPQTDIAKMSCEQFEHPAQNKRYLGDLINKLVVEARDGTDTFEDVPLDTRHHTFEVKPRFPKEWRLTDERRKELEDIRKNALLLDRTKEEDGKLVDGVLSIQRAFAPPAKTPERVPVPLDARGRGPASAWERAPRI